MPSLPTPIDANTAHWNDMLRDGTHIDVRAITAHDGAAERSFIQALSPSSRRFRFLGQVGTPSDVMIARFTDIDYTHDVAFVATLSADPQHAFIGVSRYGVETGSDRCECAVTVSDDWQGRGVGAVMMQHLIDVARSRGIGTMYSIDSAENRCMADLAQFLGFRSRSDPADATQTLHELTL